MVKKDSEVGRPLPRTRREALKDIFRYRFFDICAVSLLSFIFAVPSLIWLFISHLQELLDMNNFLSITITYGVNAILFSIMGLGSVGAFYYFKKAGYAEGSSLPGDFFEGIKKNYKEGLISHFVLGLLYLLLKIDISALANLGLDSYLSTSLAGLSYGLFFIFALLILFYLPQAVIYEGSFMRLCGNSFRFLGGKFFHVVGVGIIFFLPFGLFEFITNYYAWWILFFICLIFYYGFSVLLVSFLSLYLFDISINPRYFPSLLHKGLDSQNEEEVL